jgi:hypothetical protein
MNRNPVRVAHRHDPRDSAKPLNPRQELYAQALARGMSQAAAYREAGYKNAQATPRMKKYPNVQARIEQLLAEAAARSVITNDQLSDYLLNLIELHKDSQTPAMLQMARAAVMDLAKINGLLDAKGKPRQQACTCGGDRITEIRRVVVEPDGREWAY